MDVQCASLLMTNFRYYLKLRKTFDFEMLKQSIVSENLFETFPKQTVPHILVRQMDSWFNPLDAC